MLSFADYRKEQLKETIKDVCLKEGVKKHFEILRLELLEAIKLPQVLSEGAGMAERAEYNLFVEEDFQYNRAFIEELIHLHKLHFHDELMMEVDMAAASPMADMDNFKAKLVEEVKRMMSELRDQIRAILNPENGAAGPVASTSHDGGSAEAPAVDSPTPAAAHSSGNGSAGGGGAPMGSADNLQVGDHTPPAAAAAGGGGGGHYPNWSDYKGDSRPDQGGAQPANYGKLRPKDGFWSGMGRLARRATRPLRRIWHNDPTREMGKHMKRESVEQIITENWDQIEPLLVDFEKNMLGYIDTSFANIGMPGAPSVPSSSEELGDEIDPITGDAVPDEDPGAVPTMPIGASDTAIPDDSIPGEVDQERVAGPALGARAYNKKMASIADAGAEALGIPAYEKGTKLQKEVPSMLEKIVGNSELRKAIGKYNPPLGEILERYRGREGATQKSRNAMAKEISKILGTSSERGNPSWDKFGRSLLQQVGLAINPDLQMPTKIPTVRKPKDPMEPSGLPEDPNGEAAGEVRDENPNFVTPQQSTRSGAEIDPVVAAAENPAGHITAQDASQEAIPDDTLPEEQPERTTVKSVVGALNDSGLYDAFRKMITSPDAVHAPTQKDVSNAINHFVKEKGMTVDSAISTTEKYAAKNGIATEAPPVEEAPPGTSPGRRAAQLNNIEREGRPEGSLPLSKGLEAELDTAGPEDTDLAPSVDRGVPDDLTNPGLNQGSITDEPEVNDDDFDEIGDDDLDAELTSQSDDISSAIKGDPYFDAIDWAAESNSQETAMIALADKMYDQRDPNDPMGELAAEKDQELVDAMLQSVEDDMRTTGGDPNEMWKDMMSLIRSGQKSDLATSLNVELEEAEEELSGDASDEMMNDPNEDEYMPIESFSHKVNRLKKQLKESSKMGKSKYKKQRETILG